MTHGDDYYFLCQDALSSELTDPEVRQVWAISSAELTAAIKRIPLSRQVLILDTCAAGRFIEKLTDRREIPSAQIRALERVKDIAGTHILAGCAADAVSYEASAYAQGLLTHSLLMGMRGAALKEDQFVDVATLFHFTADKVPQLARDIGGIQRPVITSPRGGGSFPFGQITEADRPLIPLQTVRPMVVRTTLNHADLFADTLKLSRRVDETLRSRRVSARDVPLVFVDAPDFPSGYQIAGKYQTVGERLTVDIRLLRETAGMLTPIAAWTVEGQTSLLDALAAKIVTDVEERLKAK